tara:strand:+ start:213 stop:323 length:111 start_codon:yes stop_codon:yes gene_type:complete
MAQLMRVNPAKASIDATAPDYLPDTRFAHSPLDAQP